MDENFKLSTYVLATRAVPESHTADYLMTKLEEISTEFGIRQKVALVSTDNGANIVKAVHQVAQKVVI